MSIRTHHALILRRSVLALACSTALVMSACGGSDDDAPAAATVYATLSGKAPLVIGHRGAAGFLPEHTLEGYKLAIEQGADYIEPDLVMTQDGHLIARHEPMLDGTTDIAAKFNASRKTTRMLDGISTTAYFANDFTLAEIKTLRAMQSGSARPQQYNGLYKIPTLDEVIALAKAEGTKAGRTIGIYPEIKHSTFMAGIFGANVVEDAVVINLHAAYGNSADAPVFIQSFEVSNLQYLHTKTSIRLIQLIDADDVNADGSMSLVAPYRQPYDFVVKGDTRLFSDLLTGPGLDFVKTYASGIGPWKPYLVKTVDDGVDRNGDGKLTINDRRVVGSTGVTELAHQKGLMVHTWTFRNDASGYGFSDPKAEMQYYMKLGIDGVFTDFPVTGAEARAGVL
jgi:glycerophosphoryl diester phosphodiesterase